MVEGGVLSGEGFLGGGRPGRGAPQTRKNEGSREGRSGIGWLFKRRLCGRGVHKAENQGSR